MLRDNNLEPDEPLPKLASYFSKLQPNQNEAEGDVEDNGHEFTHCNNLPMRQDAGAVDSLKESVGKQQTELQPNAPKPEQDPQSMTGDQGLETHLLFTCE